MRKRQDLTGQVFGTIKVLGFAGKDKHGKSLWDCICQQCGRISEKNSHSLLSNKQCMSCSRKKHDESRSMLYRRWRRIMSRCDDKNHISFCNYGGRGIFLCEEWRNYETFKQWAIENGYKKGMTIDRIDVNKNYCPENCRWVTVRVQENNRRNNRKFKLNGEEKTMTEWARIYNINVRTLKTRLRKGYKIEIALTMKVDKRYGQSRINKIAINGITKSLYDWCEVFQVNISTVKSRIKKGMPLIEALGVSNG